MNIVVCIKQVPDTNNIKIDPKTNNLIRLGVPCVINPFDDVALRFALSLRRYGEDTVTALSMGLSQAKPELEYCMELGADRAVLLSDKSLGGSDTLATGYALSKTIEKLGYDLIICGLEAVDGCTAQVGPQIAENLGIPQLTYAMEISLTGDDHIKVKRKTQEYTEWYVASVPALVCVYSEDKELPFISAQPPKTSQDVEVWNAGHLDRDRIGVKGSPTRVAKIESSRNGAADYLFVDSELSSEERIDFILSGGMNINNQVEFIRGDSDEISDVIVDNLMRRS
jgi:electron transfer flavoprotein beta subunit